MSKGILERLAEGPVLGDGGYLLELEKRGYVQAGPFTPEVVIEHPDALAQLHREFLRAGAEVLQTMTFYASDDKLATVGLAGKVDEINRDAVGIARKVAAEGGALVAGNLSLTWAYDPADPKSADHVRELFDRQLQEMIESYSALAAVAVQSYMREQELKQELGLTYLFIAHDLAVVEHISDHVLVMYHGKIVEINTTDQITDNPQHPYTKALLDATPEIAV